MWGQAEMLTQPPQIWYKRPKIERVKSPSPEGMSKKRKAISGSRDSCKGGKSRPG